MKKVTLKEDPGRWSSPLFYILPCLWLLYIACGGKYVFDFEIDFLLAYAAGAAICGSMAVVLLNWPASRRIVRQEKLVPYDVRRNLLRPAIIQMAVASLILAMIVGLSSLLFEVRR